MTFKTQRIIYICVLIKKLNLKNQKNEGEKIC